jgi:glycosyltransferase involved in cell wall biosynthesis
MVVYGGVEHDARVRRAAAALVDAGHEVVIGSLAASPAEAEGTIEAARIVPIVPSGRTIRPGDGSPYLSGAGRGILRQVAARAVWLRGYGTGLVTWRAGCLRVLPRADVWLGHDLFGAWVAAGLAGRDRVRYLYDSHELFLEAGTAARLPGPMRAALGRLERRIARRASAVITVNRSIAGELARRYGVDPIVVLNVPAGWRPAARDPFASELALEGRSVVLYHGAVSPGRGIEQLAEVAPRLPPDRVVVILGDGPMQRDLALSADAPGLRGRLFVHRAVPIADLPDWVGSAAVGVVVFQATTRNNVLATPNKLFDYLVAGVPVVASDFPEMRRILDEVGGGVTCDPADTGALERAIDHLLSRSPDARAAERERLATMASERFGWPAQARLLVGAVEAALRQ